MSSVTVACPCPEKPHESDTVELRDRLGLAAGIAIQRLVIEANKDRPTVDAAEISGMLAEAYLLHGVVGWSFVDANGRAIPVNEGTVRTLLLADFALAAPVAEAADTLYVAAVILPLVKTENGSSLPMPMDRLTSPKRAGTSAPRTRSKRSSTGTSPTDGIGTTSPSPAGDYN